jgi:nucleoside-diphosphate-sugar epimerase
MKTIIITGGLGYVGTELIKIYPRNKYKIIVIDKIENKKKIFFLKNNNIQFIKVDIRNNKVMKKIIPLGDVLIHLAAITNVPIISKENNRKIIDDIKTTSIIGTRNIINNAKKDSKIIFISSHIVFEGLNRIRKNLIESDKLSPSLDYAKCKAINEKDIKKSGLNYIILRPGTAYGYNGDNKRMFNVPNLFAINAKRGNPIKLFSNGRQLKCIVGVHDLARGIKFFQENNYSNQIYHFASENYFVSEIALMCKKYRPKIKLIYSKNLTPNKGYTLSVKKLLKTGFKFKLTYKKFLNSYLQNK